MNNLFLQQYLFILSLIQLVLSIIYFLLIVIIFLLQSQVNSRSRRFQGDKLAFTRTIFIIIYRILDGVC
jgi:hypothetical protein